MDIRVHKRTIELPALTSVGVKGDVAVEQMRFTIDRYTSAGVDLSKGIGYVVYELPDGTSDRETCPIEVVADDESKIVMTLLLYGMMMQQDGIVKFCLKISDLEGALWQSNTAMVCVGDTIGEDTSAFSTFNLKRPYTDTYTYTDTSPITVTERTLHIPSARRTIAVASDENSNRVTIQVPRYFSGYDLGQYEFMLHTEVAKYGVDDIVFNGIDGNEKVVNSNTVDLTWVLRPPQTSYAGTLRIQLYVTGTDFAWHSLIASLTVAPHLTGDPVIPVTPTVYQQYLTEVQEAVSTGRTVLADTQVAATEAAQSANAAQQAVTEVEAIVAGNTAYTKRETDLQTAPPIVPVATGENIVVNDSADRPLVGLKLFGKSTQDGTPTPDAPVEIVSVGNTGSITVSVGVDASMQNLTIQTPNGLPGIPVTTGGNYTDKNGQQWVCDEVDFGRGVYVQRVFTEERAFAHDDLNDRYTATLTHLAKPECATDNGIPMLCNALEFNALAGNGNPKVNGIRGARTSPQYAIAYYNGEAIGNVTVSYPIATPIETALTADEIAAFQALRSHKLTTTVLNDAGAGMQLEYVADTKTYIDNANVRSARIGEVELLASAWVGETYPYSQVVNIPGVTVNSQVDLTPSVEQLAIFHQKSLGFVTENEDGVVTVYAIGDKPQHDYTIQVTITEVRK